MKTLNVLLLAPFLLVGCYNISSYTTLQYINSNNEETINNEQTEVVVHDCPLYVPLPPIVLPDVPVDKIRKAALKNDQEVINLMTKHIRELRERVATRKKEELEHYQNYLIKCNTEVK